MVVDIEFIGYMAGFTVALSLLPQVIKSWRTKSAGDISIIWTLFYIMGLTLWLIYGIGISSYPLIITISIEAGMAVSLLVLKLLYK